MKDPFRLYLRAYQLVLSGKAVGAVVSEVDTRHVLAMALGAHDARRGSPPMARRDLLKWLDRDCPEEPQQSPIEGQTNEGCADHREDGACGSQVTLTSRVVSGDPLDALIAECRTLDVASDHAEADFEAASERLSQARDASAQKRSEINRLITARLSLKNQSEDRGRGA